MVVPGVDTGAYKNFARQVMKRKEIAYDLMTYRSTMAIDVVEHFPWSISAIAQGAAVDNKYVIFTYRRSEVMMKSVFKRFISVVVILLIATVGYLSYEYWIKKEPLPDGLIQANGRIEGDHVAIASKFSG